MEMYKFFHMLIYVITLTQMICSDGGTQDENQTPNDSIYIFKSREYHSNSKGIERSFGYFNVHIKLKKTASRYLFLHSNMSAAL